MQPPEGNGLLKGSSLFQAVAFELRRFRDEPNVPRKSLSITARPTCNMLDTLSPASHVGVHLPPMFVAWITWKIRSSMSGASKCLSSWDKPFAAHAADVLAERT